MLLDQTPSSSNTTHITPGASADWNFYPFAAFLSFDQLGTAPDNWGQTLPPEYAEIDIDQLLFDVANPTPVALDEPPPTTAEPTDAELEHL